MTLPIGARLGSYEILSLLGAGGMGEVYRARDTRLHRDVAIKVLPDAVAHDTDRLLRFKREAQVLASLNHPHIAAIYGFEESDGISALVLELVEGPTLADRISKGPIPLDEALPIARQIAEALEAAHEHGIVHRDLKPANIKLTADGAVKVLDFGLAKALDPEPSSVNMSLSPTLSSPAMTRMGVIMGTAAYMSPEQAKGKSVDKRTDIWAYGVVLYEMLTGERPFDGETVSDVLALVITKNPDLSRLPANVRKLIEACLEKDPKRRLRDIGDAGRLLEEGAAGVQPAAALAIGWSARRWIWPAIAAVLFVALAALAPFALRHLRETPTEAPPLNASLLPPDGTTFDFNTFYALPALSPDGRWIVFGAKSSGLQLAQLWLRRLDASTAQPLPGTEGASMPFWSPDSRYVGFGAAGKLKKVDITGGPPVTVTDLTGGMRGASWSPEGVILFSVNNPSPVLRVSAAGGTASPATALDKGEEANGNRAPWFLPDGRHFLYEVPAAQGDMPIRVGSLDEPGRAGPIVAQANSNAVYAQGHLLYLRETTLMAQPFDVERLATSGEAVPIAERIPSFGSPSRLAGFTVSSTGVLVYQTGASGRFQLTWFDRSGKQIGVVGDQAEYGDLELSPDGTRAAVNLPDSARRTRDIWFYDLRQGLRTQFTFDPADEASAVWSPDGTRVVFSSNRKGNYDLYEKPASGAANEQVLLEDSSDKYVGSWSQDGRFIQYFTGAVGGQDVWVLPISGDRKPFSFLQTRFAEARPRFSPDGRWIAYMSNESQSFEVYVAAFPGPGGKWKVSTAGGRFPRWRRDGRELFYLAPDNKLMAAAVSSVASAFEVGVVRPLFDTGATTSGGYAYDVSRDGQRFLVNTVVEEASSAPITLLVNWPALLKK